MDIIKALSEKVDIEDIVTFIGSDVLSFLDIKYDKPIQSKDDRFPSIVIVPYEVKNICEVYPNFNTTYYTRAEVIKQFSPLKTERNEHDDYGNCWIVTDEQILPESVVFINKIMTYQKDSMNLIDVYNIILSCGVLTEMFQNGYSRIEAQVLYDLMNNDIIHKWKDHDLTKAYNDLNEVQNDINEVISLIKRKINIIKAQYTKPVCNPFLYYFEDDVKVYLVKKYNSFGITRNEDKETGATTFDIKLSDNQTTLNLSDFKRFKVNLELAYIKHLYKVYDKLLEINSPFRDLNDDIWKHPERVENIVKVLQKEIKQMKVTIV